MALTFFWRCESGTFSAGVDSSAGDSTPTNSGSPTYDAAANCGVGTNGLLIDASSEQVRFDTSTSLFSTTVGAIGFLFRRTVALSNGFRPLQIRGNSAGNQYSLQFVSSDEIEFIVGDPDGSPVKATTTAVNLASNTVYGIVCRWDQPNSLLRIEIYTLSGATATLVQGITNSSGFTAPTELAAADRFRLGDVGGTGVSGGALHIKNVFVGNTYAEPIQNNFTITDVDNYVAAGTGHTGTGAATSPAATTSGAAARGVTDNPGAIALTGPVPTIAGSGLVGVGRTASGAVTGVVPTVAGAGARGVTGTGALTGPRAILNGVGLGVVTGDSSTHSRARRPSVRRTVKYAHGRRAPWLK